MNGLAELRCPKCRHLLCKVGANSVAEVMCKRTNCRHLVRYDNGRVMIVPRYEGNNGVPRHYAAK